MLRERILPQSEVIRAILLEDSPCCGVHLAAGVAGLMPLLVPLEVGLQLLDLQQQESFGAHLS